MSNTENGLISLELELLGGKGHFFIYIQLRRNGTPPFCAVLPFKIKIEKFFSLISIIRTFSIAQLVDR